MAIFITQDREMNKLKKEIVADAEITDENGVVQNELGINFLTQLYGVGYYKLVPESIPKDEQPIEEE